MSIHISSRNRDLDVMKKLTEEQRLFIAHRAEASLSNRLRRREKSERRGESIRKQRIRVHARAPMTFKSLSGNLRLLQEPASALRQMNALLDLNKPGKKGQRVSVRMDDVVSIDAPSLLLLCSRIQLMSDRYRALVSGTYPKHSAARQALREAGFDEFLTGQPQIRVVGRPNVALIQGVLQNESQVRGEFANELLAFLQARHAALGEEESLFIYLAVMEAIENIHLHAYGKGETSITHRGWYVVGVYDAEAKASIVSVLDLGVGIEASARLNPNRFMLSVGDLLRFRSSADIVELAMTGTRTETGEAKRGRGLSYLRTFAMEKAGRTLQVISSGAVVTCTSGGVTKANIPVCEGTVLTLEIKTLE